jgi:hypothetical protein
MSSVARVVKAAPLRAAAALARPAAAAVAVQASRIVSQATAATNAPHAHRSFGQ